MREEVAMAIGEAVDGSRQWSTVKQVGKSHMKPER
jgi:hypothetical protein